MKRLFLLILLFSFFIAYPQQQNINLLQSTSTIVNPIFSGDYPDPSLLVDGENYYLVHSSFEYYPGLTIWHSKDLINWRPLVSALKQYVGSVWAPDLVKYHDRYYIYFPANGTNYVIVADSIKGPWSEPIDLKIGNIDPGHVVDDKGNRYLYFSSGGYVPLTDDGLKIAGEFSHVYNGWPIPREWSIECFCMEGPKLFKYGNYYYLTVAEGGTAGPATGHMVISARSKSPLGPWENSPYNPIIRAKSDSEKWWSVGHATIFEGNDNKWWMIFHGYEKGYYNMGRQTLLAPIEWTNEGWFKLPDNFKIDQPIEFNSKMPQVRQFSLNDDFKGPTLNLQWKFFGEYDTSRFFFTENGLVLKTKGNSVANSSPLLCMPSDHSYEVTVELLIENDAIGGLVLFYNPKAYSGILADSKNIMANLRGWQFVTEKNVIDKHVFLKLRNHNHTVDMFYSLNEKDWIKIENSTEVSGYHHNVLSDFLSLRIGLVSIGNGKVIYRKFRYQSLN
ncbi:MAG: family 43 glycosylhydrolase [Bacteroidales bacterium]|nr:family 43 glycosylhydrolase [Bacteroidales bacterium]